MNEMGLSPTENKVYFGQLLGMCDQISFPLGMSPLSADTKSKLVSKCVTDAYITLTSGPRRGGTLLRQAPPQRALLKVPGSDALALIDTAGGENKSRFSWCHSAKNDLH